MKILYSSKTTTSATSKAISARLLKALSGPKQQADIVVFSELCICGTSPRDFLEFDDFISKCFDAINIIKEHADTIAVLVGAPDRNPVRKEKTF